MRTFSNTGWGKPPTPGEMNRRIAIMEPRTELDADGYPVTTDRKYCEAWARAVQSGDAQQEGAGGNVSVSAMNFATYWIDGLREGMIVMTDGVRYEIQALGEIDPERRYIEMKTARAREMTR